MVRHYILLSLYQSDSDLKALSNDLVNTLHSRLIDLKLIIDEISMVGSKMFSQFDSRLKQIFKNSSPFGGISVIVLGDLRQLSPVGSTIYASWLWDLFKYFELTEIMRQREDQTFASALNNMASENVTTPDDISLIRSRMMQFICLAQMRRQIAITL